MHVVDHVVVVVVVVVDGVAFCVDGVIVCGIWCYVADGFATGVDGGCGGGDDEVGVVEVDV